MKKNHFPFLLAGGLLLLFFVAFLIWGFPYFFQPFNFAGSADVFGSKVEDAEIVKILEEGTITLGDVTQPYQVLQVKIIGGKYDGVLLEVEYGKYQQRPGSSLLMVGDAIFVTLDKRPDGVISAYYTDYNRSFALWVLLGVFVLSILLMAQRKGVGALVSLAFSLLVIIGYIIPHILAGEDPVRVSLIGSAILLGTTLYLTYGWNIKTHSAVISIFFALVITGTLSIFFVNLAHLSGFGDENALFLTQVSSTQINLKGLLLGGMIIGALGVLDDLVTSQTAVAFELFSVDPTLGFREIFKRSMRIGQDHIAATVNTLFLAYSGASLPLLLLFALGRGNVPYLLNAEFVTEEIVRTLVGSIGLIAAVPISTVVAAFTVKNSHRLGDLIHYLGAVEDEQLHGHHH